MFENTEDGFQVVEPILDKEGNVCDFRYLAANPAFERQVGVKRSEILGKTAKQVFPTIEQYWIDMYSKVLRERKTLHYEDYFDSVKRWYHLFYFLFSDGKIGVLFRDITERKKAEEALRASEERHRIISDITTDFVFSCVKTPKNEFVVDWMAGAVEKIFGYSASEIREKGCWKFSVLPQDLSIFEEKVTGLKPGQSSVSELRVTHKSGSTVWLEVVARTEQDDSNPKNNRLFGACRDITERKKAEDVLQEQGVAISSALDAIFSTDASFVIKSWNKAAERIFGWTAEEVVGKASTSIFNIKYPTLNGESRKQVAKKLMDKGFWKGEVIYNKKDGSLIPVSASVSLVKDKNDNVTGMIVIAHDISRRKRREEKLRRSEWVARQRAEELEQLQAKLEMKAVEVEEYATRMEELAEERARKLQDAERLAAIGATAGMVGHDIRNPLQSIVGDLYLIASDAAELAEGEEKEGIKESVASIRRNVDYIDKIIQDLQDYAKPLKPVAKVTSLEEIVQELLLDVSFPENIDAKYVFEEEAKEVVADPALLKRILQNLVNNAIQAMPEGGKLEIKSCQENGDIVISVQDSGVGIPEEAKPKLFTPLFTTKSKGQGFGLPVVKRMTEALGGTVAFESEEGKGTKFILRFPSAKTA